MAGPVMAAQLTGAVHRHINADEPSIIDHNTAFKKPVCADSDPDDDAIAFRSSDHGSVIIGLSLGAGATARRIIFPALLLGGGLATALRRRRAAAHSKP